MPDLTRRRLKDLTTLGRKRHRDRLGQCLVEGVRSVEAAVAARAPLVEILVTHEAAETPRVAALAVRTDVPVYHVAAADFARITDTSTTQGVAAVARTVWSTPSDLDGSILALDGVQDPGNVGAIVRSAAWFGARGVLVGAGTADPFGPKAVRAAMGGLWDLRFAASDDLESDLHDLGSRGLPLWGADLEGEAARDWSPPSEGVLVLGSEAHGLSGAVRNLLTGKVRIGSSHPGREARGVESLNVAVAAGVLLHRWLGG